MHRIFCDKCEEIIAEEEIITVYSNGSSLPRSINLCEKCGEPIIKHLKSNDIIE